MKAKIKEKMNQKGFSLIELMVVIVIMLILAAIAIPAFLNVVNDAKVSAAKSEARSALMLGQMREDKGEDMTDATVQTAAMTEARIATADQGFYTWAVSTDGAVSLDYDDGDGITFTLPE